MRSPVKTKYLGRLLQNQAFCIKDGKYYSVSNGYISVQNADFTEVQTSAIEIGHPNSIQLGNDGYAYISGWDDQKVYVVDLDTLTVISTITLPTAGWTTCAVDTDNSLVYIFQRSTYPNSKSQYNFIVYDYDNDQTILTKQTYAFSAAQSYEFYHVRIILIYGGGTSALPNGYDVYDTNGNVLANYNIAALANVEPEGGFINRENGTLLVSEYNRHLYSITT